MSAPLLDRVRRLLRKVKAKASAHGRKVRARKADAALNDLRHLKPAPKPTPPPKSAPHPKFSAIVAARVQSQNGPAFPEGTCLQQVRTCFGIPARDASAAAAWAAAKVKHRETDPHKIPRGYPVFWTGGSHGFGHIAISAGDGNCWTSDLHRTGFFDYAPISEVHDRWGLTLVGYTEDINGETVMVG